MKKVLLLLLCVFGLNQIFAYEKIDPSIFKDMIKPIIKNDSYKIDKVKIKIKVPNFADNPVQVPIFVDAKNIKNAKRLVILADYNPIPKVIDMEIKHILPVFSTNIKVAHETPLRVLVQDTTNTWHIASSNINSSGGGCDVTSLSSKNKDFEKLLGNIKSKIFNKKDRQRIKASIFHPMETGLIFGNPEFFIEKILIKNNDVIISKIQTTSVISENPRFIFETEKSHKNLSIHFVDNTGSEFKAKL